MSWPKLEVSEHPDWTGTGADSIPSLVNLGLSIFPPLVATKLQAGVGQGPSS